MRQATVLVIGSLNMDLVVHTPRVPDDGETLLGTSFHQYFGGKGANQAVAVARQGVRTFMAGRVGSDFFGQDQLASLQEEGINTRYTLVDSQKPSGVASIIIDSAGNNRIIVVAGANGNVSVKDIENLKTVMSECDCVVLQMEIPLEAILATIKQASLLGVKVILNPAPVQVLPEDIYQHLALITPNETEAALLTEIEVKDLVSAKQAGKLLLDKGVAAVVITLGARGVYGVNRQGEFHFPAYEVEVVDTVAAGDTFTGALAALIGEGRSLFEAARYANAAAAIAVTRYGAQPSIPRRLEVEEFLKRADEGVPID